MESLISSSVFQPPFVVRFPPKQPARRLLGDRQESAEGEAQPSPFGRREFAWAEEKIVPLTDPVTEDLWHVLRIPCVVLEHASPRCVAVYFHGNAETVACEGMLDFCRALGEGLHARVYVVEYPGPDAGCGWDLGNDSAASARHLPPCAGYWLPTGPEVASPPKASQGEAGLVPRSPGPAASDRTRPPAGRAANLYAAGLAATERIAERVMLPLIIVGFSLGTAPALHVAAHERLRSRALMVVLFAPLVSAISVFFRSAKLSFLYSALDMFKTEPAARALTHHAIICHGTDDNVRDAPARAPGPERAMRREVPRAPARSSSASSTERLWPA